MIVGSTKEDLTLERRVAITPDSAKNIIKLGLKISIEKNYAEHIGITDKEYLNAGVEIKNTSEDIFNTCNLLIKVNCPSENEISKLKQNTILVGMLNPNKNKEIISEIVKKKNKHIFIRTTSAYNQGSVNGCSVISIKFSRLQSSNRLYF